MLGNQGEWLGLAKAIADQWGLTIFIGSVLAIRLGLYVFHRLFDKD